MFNRHAGHPIAFLLGLLLIAGLFPIFSEEAKKGAAPSIDPEKEKLEKGAWEEISKLGNDKKYDEGITACLKFLDKNPHSVRIHFLLGQLYFNTEKYLLAREEFDYILRVKLLHKPSLEWDKKLRDLGEKKYLDYKENKADRNKLKVAGTLFLASKLHPTGASSFQEDLKELLTYLMTLKKESEFDKKWLRMVAHFNFLLGKRKVAAEYYMQLVDATTDKNEQFLIDNLMEILFKSKEEIFIDKLAKTDSNDPEFKEALDDQTKNMNAEEKEGFEEMIKTAKDLKSSLDDISGQDDKMAAINNKKQEFMKKIENKELKLPKEWQKKLEKMKSEGKNLDDVAGQFMGN